MAAYTKQHQPAGFQQPYTLTVAAEPYFQSCSNWVHIILRPPASLRVYMVRGSVSRTKETCCWVMSFLCCTIHNLDHPQRLAQLLHGHIFFSLEETHWVGGRFATTDRASENARGLACIVVYITRDGFMSL